MAAGNPSNPAPEPQEAAAKPLDWKCFLEKIPPEATVTVMTALTSTPSGDYYTERSPIQLYCDGPECESTMWFDHIGGSASATLNSWGSAIVQYKCRHCQKRWKGFAIRFKPVSPKQAHAVKIGEYPPFGPPTPPRVISLIGPDRDLFLKGRHAENRGLGIGAFAYSLFHK